MFYKAIFFRIWSNDLTQIQLNWHFEVFANVRNLVTKLGSEISIDEQLCQDENTNTNSLPDGLYLNYLLSGRFALEIELVLLSHQGKLSTDFKVESQLYCPEG